MKITEHIYKTSGVEYGTNSNTYLIDCGDELVMIDSGFDHVQWDAINGCIERWGLAEKPVTHAFITHGHYDHAGNIYRLNEAGVTVCAAEPDAGKIENGHPEMERLFGRPWIKGRVDRRICGGESFSFGGGVTLECVAAPGHSDGSVAYVINADGVRAVCTGDMFFVRPMPPEDAVGVELAYMGGWDFSMDKFRSTLKTISSLHCELLLPGHYYTYYGDVDALSSIACGMAWESSGAAI